MMPTFREQFHHFHAALFRPRHRVLPEERVAAWRIYIAGCNVVCKGLPNLTDAQTVKLNNRFRMAKQSVEDAAGNDLSRLETWAVVLELKLLQFRIWRLKRVGQR